MRTHLIVLPAQAVVGLLGYSYLPAGISDGNSLADKDFGFPQFVDDLFRSVSLPCHLSPPFLSPYTNTVSGTVFGGPVKAFSI
jgi:hypothetical protein